MKSLRATVCHLLGQPMAHSVHRHMLSSHLITNVGKLPRQLIKYFSVRRLRDVSHQERLNDIEKEATAVCDSHFAEEKSLPCNSTVATVTACLLQSQVRAAQCTLKTTGIPLHDIFIT